MLLTAFPLGIFFGCLSLKCYHHQKRKVRENCQPLHTYDEVTLKLQEPVVTKMINNEAYGMHIRNMHM